MWEMDRKNPYVNWSMGQCQIFKLVCPPELEAYLPQDHIRMCMDFVKTRCTIAAENGLKPALISNEPFWLPEQVFRDHPSWRGARCDHQRRSRHPFFSPSLDNPEVLSMYRAATRRLVEETGIDFLHFRTNDCGGGVDWSTGLYTGPNGQAAGEGRNMADRVRQPDLKGVAHALIQADELGVSIGSILRIQSDQLRGRRFDRAEKLANEAPVKMLGPLLLCIFPAVLVILLMPILMQAAHNLF